MGRRRLADNPLQHLTDREREVLALIAEGRSNHAIAERLFLTDHTIEKHVKSIFGTLRLPPSPDGQARARRHHLPETRSSRSCWCFLVTAPRFGATCPSRPLRR